MAKTAAICSSLVLLMSLTKCGLLDASAAFISGCQGESTWRYLAKYPSGAFSLSLWGRAKCYPGEVNRAARFCSTWMSLGQLGYAAITKEPFKFLQSLGRRPALSLCFTFFMFHGLQKDSKCRVLDSWSHSTDSSRLDVLQKNFWYLNHAKYWQILSNNFPCELKNF